MTWWGWLLFGTVALWLAPGSLWRPCALALLVQWAVAEGLYQATGNRLPLVIYVVGDLAVLVALVFRGSHWTDWLVALPYPVVWTLYAMPASREQWIWLYWIALGQMIAAGPWPKLQGIWGQVSHGPLRGKAVGHEGA